MKSIICITNAVKGRRNACGKLFMFDVLERRGYVTSLGTVAEFRDDVEDFVGLLPKGAKITFVTEFARGTGKPVLTYLQTWQERAVRDGMSFEVHAMGEDYPTDFMSELRYRPQDIYEFMTLCREKKYRK